MESIIICNKAKLSSQAVVLALEHNIDIIFLNEYGDPIGRVWLPKMGSTTLIRRKQLQAIDNGMALFFTKEMIGKKLENRVKFLKKLKYARPGKEGMFNEAIKALEKSMTGMEKTEGKELTDAIRERLRGLEGSGGRAFFQCISKIMPSKFRFKKRSVHPARDPFNAALNYCYGILYSQVEKACILSGLDPYMGFLHTDNYNNLSLVFDLIEPFRIWAEQTVVYLFTGKKIKENFFDRSKNGVSLNSEGKPLVVESMNKHLDESVRYRRRNIKRRFIIRHEAHRMANILIGGDIKNSAWLEITEF